MMPGKIKVFWLVSLVLVVAAAAATAVKLWPRVEVSDLYRTYADMPGIDATFLHNFRINDTTTVDVTILQANDSTSWEKLKIEFGLPALPAEFMKMIEGKNDFIMTYIAASDYKEQFKKIGIEEMDVIAGNYTRKNIGIFHVRSKEQQHALLHYNLNKSI